LKPGYQLVDYSVGAHANWGIEELVLESEQPQGCNIAYEAAEDIQVVAVAFGTHVWSRCHRE
jgi:hypothetical protein